MLSSKLFLFITVVTICYCLTVFPFSLASLQGQIISVVTNISNMNLIFCMKTYVARIMRIDTNSVGI